MTDRALRRLLVVGGAGFLGSTFVRLLRQGRPEVAVTVLDKLTYAGNSDNLAGLEEGAGFRFVRGDLADAKVVDGLAGEADAIVNFAAETHVDRSLLDPLGFVQTNVLGVGVLAEAARRHGHRVFLQVSTDEVYGHVPEGRSREADALRPTSPYSASKAGGELLAHSFLDSFGLPVVITRGSNSYGPFQFPEKIIPLYIVNAIEGLPLPLYGDGSALRDYLYSEDHCRGIEAALFRGVPGEAYNLGTGVETSGRQVAQAIAESFGPSAPAVEMVRDRAGHDYRYALDSSKARQDLGWHPEVGFAEGLARTIAWYREHEPWWRSRRDAAYWDFYRRNYQPVESRP